MTILFMTGRVTLVFAWGAWRHQHINRDAVFGLPAEMRPFFYNHIDFITEKAVVPDLRKYTINDRAEFPRHYINLESYDPQGDIAGLPATMKEAKGGCAYAFAYGIKSRWAAAVAAGKGGDGETFGGI